MPPRFDSIVRALAPRLHQLRVITKPIPHQAVERVHMLPDLGGHSVEIGLRPMTAPPARVASIVFSNSRSRGTVSIQAMETS